MPYSQYNTLQSIRQKLGLQTQFCALFPKLADAPPSDWLLQTIERNTSNRTAYFNEKPRSEGIVFPILSKLLFE
ncbi:MAG: hypothetical protein RI894_2469 [Bacteroidota bacterium]|jgi:hypothetical protein